MDRLHPDSHQILEKVRRCANAAQPFSGKCYRSTSLEFMAKEDLLSGAGSKKYGGRWNPPGIAAIYLSTSQETAFLEFKGQHQRYELRRRPPYPRVFHCLEVRLRGVLDLTDGRIRQRLQISRTRMVQEDWALAQAVGSAAFEQCLEALLVPSRVDLRGSNLVIFPANLDASTSYVKLSD